MNKKTDNKTKKIEIKADDLAELRDALAINLWAVAGRAAMPEYTPPDGDGDEGEEYIDILSGGGNGEYDFASDYSCRAAGSIWIERFRGVCECVAESVEYTIYAIHGRRMSIDSGDLEQCGIVLASRVDGTHDVVLADTWEDVDMDDVAAALWVAPTEYPRRSCCGAGDNDDDGGYYAVIEEEI